MHRRAAAATASRAGAVAKRAACSDSSQGIDAKLGGWNRSVRQGCHRIPSARRLGRDAALRVKRGGHDAGDKISGLSQSSPALSQSLCDLKPFRAGGDAGCEGKLGATMPVRKVCFVRLLVRACV